MRYNPGALSTRYTYTGQYSHLAEFGLYFYNARWYSPTLGRFVSADTVTPPGVQGLDRYGYVNNNPLVYTDPSGHCPWCIAVGVALIVLKVVDYGWTAYDAWQSTRTLSDPTATESEKAFAATNLAMTVAFEAAEPDDELPIGLPLDDLARHGIIKLGKEAGEEAAEETVESAARGGTYRLLDRATGEVQYVGRTKDLAQRRAQHSLDPIKGQLKFEVDWMTDDYLVQRGREQVLYDVYQPPLNRIRPISLRNPRLEEYLNAARRFGEELMRMR